MEDFEKLGAFYLGRPYDTNNKQAKDGLLLYDSKDLVTHAVCVGMTGSGKTGLCIALLEEAAIDNIPAIVIDPKGDLTNLLLTFPDLRPEDFAAWVNQEDAAKKGLTVEQFAAQQAELWRKGLAEWGQSGERIRRLKDAADFRVYTPGSNAGFPVSILSSVTAPQAVIREDNEMLNERVSTTVTSLMGLLGIEADPIKSREHILLSNIISEAWTNGNDLDLASLIQQIQSPSITKVGVMELESFFPAKDRFELAMMLNNLLAAPGFKTWLEGEQLDLQNILHTPDGKPRIAIFSIAHLNDAERMFFVSLLLNQTLGWVRTQSGTTSLRAILYMDEIFGYFPPVANPPSKLPLLTLLKQGRAFGLGVVLATQNPVDLDYKGLANTGTWFIGRLQTERDKARVIEGLEGVATSAGQRFDKQKIEQTLAGLGNRIFLLNNVHEDAHEIFESRWAMSYLRGPLTRTQIKSLMDPVKGSQAVPSAAAVAVAAGAGGASASTTPGAAKPVVSSKSASEPSQSRPVLPPEISEYFIPIRSTNKDASLVYHPMILGNADVRFADQKIDTSQAITLLAPFADGPVAVEWASAAVTDVPLSDLEQSPEEPAQFSDLPTSGTKAKSYESWKKDLANWIYRNKRLDLLRSPNLDVTGSPGESERDFRIRLLQAAREKRDEAVERLREKYAPKFAALEERRRKAAQAIQRETEQASSQKVQTAISFGATILSSFLGRKSIGLSTLGRATTAARGVSRSMKEAGDVDRAQESLQTLDQRLAELNNEFKEETTELEQSFNPQTEELETISLKPTKANISVKLLTLAWAPHWRDSQGHETPAWQ
jgi:hypothetical protein